MSIFSSESCFLVNLIFQLFLTQWILTSHSRGQQGLEGQGEEVVWGRGGAVNTGRVSGCQSGFQSVRVSVCQGVSLNQDS